MSETEARVLYELINKGWQLGKYYFNNKPNTPLEYDKFTDFGNDLLKTQQKGTKEYKFLKRMLEAVNEYCDSEWRETHTGIQTSLFKK